jgi:predicted RNase H-like nuclease (RuvC/YqgF family)
MKDKNIDKFEAALLDKKVPLVILDNKWHQLFQGELRTLTLTNLENKLNKLLRRQGQLYNELKEMESAKKTLMDKILENMNPEADKPSGILKGKKLDASRRLITDLNQKLSAGEKELEELPIKIDDVNKMLLIEGMRICYKALRDNKQSIKQIDAWIYSVREELKKNVVKKQQIEEENIQMYSYMHDILGFEIVDIFDMYDEAPPVE